MKDIISKAGAVGIRLFIPRSIIPSQCATSTVLDSTRHIQRVPLGGRLRGAKGVVGLYSMIECREVVGRC